jgi:hypothetical protein
MKLFFVKGMFYPKGKPIICSKVYKTDAISKIATSLLPSQ